MKKHLKVRGTQERIELVEVNIDTVYIRSNVISIDTEDFKGWEYDETQYDVKEYIAFISELENRQDKTDPLVQRIKTATEIYNEYADTEDIPLDNLKQLRIGKLKEECQEAIFKGFTLNGNEFKMNQTDQTNLTQMFLLVVAGQATNIQWKTVNNGVIELTPEQFKGVVAGAEQYKMTQQAKYWTLEQAINSATTRQQVKDVVW